MSDYDICDCGHYRDQHYRDVGTCLADVWRAELGRHFGCFCPQWDPADDDKQGIA